MSPRPNAAYASWTTFVFSASCMGHLRRYITRGRRVWIWTGRVDISAPWGDDRLMLRGLFFATLVFVSSRAASGQELSVLHIKIVVVDAERKTTPVPRHM